MALTFATGGNILDCGGLGERLSDAVGICPWVFPGAPTDQLKVETQEGTFLFSCDPEQVSQMFLQSRRLFSEGSPLRDIIGQT